MQAQQRNSDILEQNMEQVEIHYDNKIESPNVGRWWNTFKEIQPALRTPKRSRFAIDNCDFRVRPEGRKMAKK